MYNGCSFEMSLNKTKAHGLLFGFFPGNDCCVIVYGMESLVTGDDKPKGHNLYFRGGQKCKTF